MGILDRIKQEATRSPTKELATTGLRDITTVDEYAAYLSNYVMNYTGGLEQTLNGEPIEQAPNTFEDYVYRGYASNGAVFALMMVRMMAFSAIRFQWQQINKGRPGKLFGTPDLSLLEKPWVGGTTQDLLMKMITDADLAGNAYVTNFFGELIRLRPDWVAVILEPRIPDPRFPKQVLGYKKVGYIYKEDGLYSDKEAVIIPANEMCHFAPYPDPLATFRGMSWLTPVIRETMNDDLMSKHQKKFFENGATPNMIVRLDAAVSFEEFKKFKAEFNLEHKGAENAYKTLFMGGGADATVVGSDFGQMAFTSVQGRGETRLAAAAGVPATIVGFSEGLQGSSLNAGNFAQARRRLADLTMHPLWSNVVGCLQGIVGNPPDSVRLWYDARDVPFLREDAKDVAEIMQIKATILTTLVNGGVEFETAKQFVMSEDMDILKHTGLVSVQLQPPGTVATPAVANSPAPVVDGEE